MKKILHWNLDSLIEETPESQWWFLGSFMNSNPNFLSNTVELKWVTKKKWFIKPWLSSKEHLRTYCVLISGKMKVTFHDINEEVVLEKTWDYVYFDTHHSDHSSCVLEDCVLLAIRWKED